MVKKALLLASMALLLTACESPEEQAEAINRRLPDGCEFRDLGAYRDGHVAMVRCPGEQVTTTTRYYNTGNGKHRNPVGHDLAVFNDGAP